MKHIFVSLSPNPPDGFEYRIPTEYDLFNNYVALFTDSLATATSSLDDFSERVAGILITKGDHFSHTSMGPALWHLTIPVEMFPTLFEISAGFLNTISLGQAAIQENRSLKNELAHCREFQAEISENHILNTQRLGKKVEELQLAVKMRERTEDALRFSEERYRLLIENQTDLIVKVDTEGKFQFVSPSYCKLFGKTEAELLGNTFMPLVHEDDLETTLKAMENLYHPPNTAYMEQRALTKDGWKWLGWLDTAVKDESGNICAIIGVGRDIHERKIAEEKLSESERRYRTIFNATSDALVIHDENGNILDVNQRMCKLFGIDRDMIPEINIDMLSEGIHPYSQADALENIRKTITEGPQVFEWRSRRYDGTLFWSEVALKSTQIDGESRVIASLRDINDRKKAEEKLSESQQMLQLILDHFPVRVFWKDKNLNFLGNNLLHAQDRGLNSPEEIIGKSDFSFFPPEEANLYRSDDFEVIKTKAAKLNIEEPQTRFDGSSRWLRTSKVPLLAPDGEIIGLLGTYEDITEQKYAMEALKKAQNYISNVIDSMPSILVGVDANGKITQWNREAQRVTGLPPEEALSQPLEKAIPRLHTELERVRRAIHTGEVQTDSQRPYKVNDENRYEDITIYPLFANGIEGAVIRVDDVTEQVRLEEMMIQSEKMLSVGGLAAGMAHEINNPLAGMIQTANVMANRLSQDLPANIMAATDAGTSMDAIRSYMETRDIPRMLADINHSGQRVAEIVSNMLSFARRSDSLVTSHQITELLDKALELAATDYDLKKQYDFKTIQIIKDYEDDLPLLPCEGSKIQQVFFNILRNGAQAMQSSPNIAIIGKDQRRKSCFILRAKYDGGKSALRIEIEDNGPGMDEETRKRIFEPFFTTKPVGEGTGLGLSVSYFIITENHNGTIDVISEPGKGSCFIIHFPVERNFP